MKQIYLVLSLLFLTNYSNGQDYPLIFNFDTLEPIFIDSTLTNNIWQIGAPQKVFLNNPYTAPNVMITDTINFYPNSNRSEFIIQTPTFVNNSWGGISMSFFHKFDTDTLMDGGTIEVSFDQINWTNLINSTDHVNFPYFFYSPTDTVTSLNDAGFSGRSDGWQKASVYWNYPPGDTLYLKFIFASDEIQSNREGWMIDSLIFYYDWGIGINENNNQSSFSVVPNPFKDFTSVKFDNPNRQAYEFLLYDAYGNLVRVISNITAEEFLLQRKELSSGLNFFQLISKKKIMAIGKLITN